MKMYHKMASECEISGLIVSTVGLINSSTSFLKPAKTLSTNTSFTFPPGYGATGVYYVNAGGGIGTWVSSTGGIYPPVANDDFYRIRTNELLSGNVVTGIGGNTGGIDTPGNNINPIQSITVVTPPKQGVLTITGATGAFTYRSNPRYTGLDFFCYKVVDSAGIASDNRATCTISVESNPPLGDFTGPYFIYSSTGSTNVIQYNDGTETTLFTASYPFGPTGAGVGSLATNREDNLIYYCSSNATGVSMGRIYAYDYVNNYQFLLADARNDSRFPANSFANFTLAGACYQKSMLYIYQNGTGGTGMYKISVAPYSYTGGGGSQPISGVMFTRLRSPVISPSLTWDPLSSKLLLTGTTGSTGQITLFNTSAAFEIYTFTGPTAGLKITTGPDNVFYTIARGSTMVQDIAVSPYGIGNRYANISSTTIADMSEYISQPV